MGRIASPGPAESIEQARSLEVGQRVRFRGEKQARFTVRARGERFVVLTKPFNVQHTCLYTVIDLERGVRGADNYGGLGYETESEIADSLRRFEEGDAGISGRNNVSLDIVAVK